MTDATTSRLEALFHQALELPTHERAAFLENACDADVELREHVRALLDAHDSAPPFLDRPAVAGAGREELLPSLRTGDSGPSLVGQRIGPFRVERLIGSGGMGSVYEAIQDRPQRRVALKVMRTDVSSPSLLRRFEYEAEVLGLLRHPGIAQIHHAGTYSGNGASVPYFAMEYLPDARPITEHVIAGHLPVRSRLELLAGVCDAVHYGHQKGVIHRDLKPANILVDADGTTKVIDFGVAKATNADLAIATLQSEGRELIGTLQYMSPEQCDADAHQVDVRSDVYSLGVVLYELLCERPAHDLRDSSIAKAIRTIKEQDPVPPSQVQRFLRGDLQTIILKACEKDVHQRYTSAAALAADIRRYLNREPIEGRPPTFVYQMRKFADRNRAVAAGVGVAVLGLLMGMAGTVWQAVRATRERDRAIAAEQRALIEADKARQSVAFLENMLGSANPAAADHELTVREVLDDAAARVDGEFQDQPAVEAAVRITIGKAYQGLGRYDDAEPHLRTALQTRRELYGERHIEVARAMVELAYLLSDRGANDEAVALYQDALTQQRHFLGRDHPELVVTLSESGLVRYNTLDYAAAEPLLEEAVRIARDRIGPKDLRTAEALNNLALLKKVKRELGAAEALYREALEIKRRLLGDRQMTVALTLHNLAGVVRTQGDEGARAAVGMYEEVVSIFRELLDSEHPYVATTLDNFGALLTEIGRTDDAEAILREGLKLRRERLGEDHLEVAASYINLAALLRQTNRAAQAEQAAARALAIRERALPEGHWFIPITRSLYAECLIDLERYEEAEVILKGSYERVAAELGADDPRTSGVRQRLVALYEAWGRPELAQPSAGVERNEAGER